MRYLLTVAALGLCTSVAAQSVILGNDSSVTTSTTITNSAGSSHSSSTTSSSRSSDASGSTSSIISNDGSSVTSSVGGTPAITNSIVGRTGSMCSAVLEGKRCEIACQAPEVAHCGNAANGVEPACFCK